ncbi:MAG: hypothetical protein PG981_001220 [Wolbachia endosymbiont of Ctenocephalides orientis wCori]|nr:MAG: hypothetical protein PG981_001220 [Wolbachia endosymbiont of Ctenocephalides orientis wCori]
MLVGTSQIQIPSSDSSKLKFAGYFATFVSLSIITNPVNVLFSLGTIFFRSEIKTFYVLKGIKIEKQQKIGRKECWEIFFKNNKVKLVSFLMFSAFITYLTFTSTFLLVSLFGTIPLTMLLVLLQSELRPKDFNPITLFKASINFFLEGIKENMRAMVNKFDNAYEHLLPHQLNEDINENINKLKDKYGEKIPDDVINNTEFKQFIDYISNSHEFNDANKGMIIVFLKEFCSNNDLKHSSGITGGQILLLVLRACNDGDNESIKNKKDALITNLIDTQTFSRKERIPNTCFTGIIYRMLGTLEGLHSDPEISFTPPRQILSLGAENEARRFMLDRLKDKKDNKEIFNAWYKLQNNPDDSNSQKIVDDFIAEISIPLMRKLFGWTLQYTEEAVRTLMKNISSMKLHELQQELCTHIGIKLISRGLNNQKNLFENIKEKVFLELLSNKVFGRGFSVGILFDDQAKQIANRVIEEEVKEFKLKADEKIKRVSPIEDQVNRTLANLSTLPQKKKCCIAYRELSSQYEGHDKEIMEDFLLKKLEVTKKEMDNMLEESDTLKLKLVLDEACRKSGKSMAEMIKETEVLVASHFLNKVSVENVETGLSR